MFDELGESEKKKSETVEFHNMTKCRVDVADQMARQYSVKADTPRWSVAVFYNILDLSGINAFVLYKKRTGDKNSRRDFLFKLATELREDCIVERSSRNASVARPHSLSTAPKKTEAKKCKQCQIGANGTQNKTSKLFSIAIKLMWQVYRYGAF